MNKTKVLIVEADVTASRLLALSLHKTGAFEVKVENDATRAFTSTHQFAPDVILMDLDMPGADGSDLADEIHQDFDFKETPIIFLTSPVSGQEANSQAVQRGGCECLPKPVSLEQVIACIDRHCRRQTTLLSDATVCLAVPWATH
jgi:DNA-binding response OmpR family regulator